MTRGEGRIYPVLAIRFPRLRAGLHGNAHSCRSRGQRCGDGECGWAI